MASTGGKTRQKSCIQCAISKRRCDRQLPVCTQCASKSSLCQYKTTPQWPSASRAEEAVAPSAMPISGNDPILEHPTTDSSSSIPVSGVDFSVLDVDETFLDIYDMQLNNQILYSQIGLMDRARIAYLIKTLRSYPSLLITTARTPFIHPFLFSPSIPSPLQDAVSACSLYHAKNEMNEVVIWEIISSLVAKLLQTRPGWTVAEHLSCVQALIILQIIRLFDGDVRARGDGEQAEDVLVEWTDQLALRTGIVTDGLENGPLETGQLMAQGWENWVFEESVKRAVIVSRMVSSMYSILKRGYCTWVEKVTELSFTAGEGLWEAKSAVHWRLALEARESFYVKRMEMGAILLRARLQDVDPLALLMLVTFLGVDDVNEWIVGRGSKALIE